MASCDWETTCLIYDDEESSCVSVHATNGRLVRGSMEISVSTAGPVYCRRLPDVDAYQREKYRFWILDEGELRFRLLFFANATQDEYETVDIALQSQYPGSFPPKLRYAWLQWMETNAREILKQEQVSYAVCLFVQEHAFDFLSTLYQDEERHLILFPDIDRGNDYYQGYSTIVASLGMASPPWYSPPEIMFERHDAGGSVAQQELSPMQTKRIWPLLVQWRKWQPVHCKICLDTVPATDSEAITCGHAFCRDCLVTYLRHKAEEVYANKTNPFVCPTCQRSILIVGCVKKFLPSDLMNKVRDWYKDLKNPPCYSVPTCLRRDCQGIMRRVAVDSDFMYCEKCSGRWCEFCLQRAPENEEHTPCKVGLCVEFCKRYLAADRKSQERCEAKWPWIKVYAKSRVDDDDFAQWVESNGQVCPGCKTGVERTSGCFHIRCRCGTHFCYHCGEEIFPPFYGTHHCWERGVT